MSLFACACLVQIVTSIEVSPPSILGSSVSILARRVRKLMLAHPARLTAKSVLFDEEYTGLYSFSVAHT